MTTATRMLLTCASVLTLSATAPAADPPLLIFNHARFFPAPGKEQAMVGGKFSGSNAGPDKGFEPLAEIKTAPASNQWTDLPIPNTKPYRWLRYDAPPGSFGMVGEMEFYAGDRKLAGAPYGSIGQTEPGHSWPRAMDGNPKTIWESDNPDRQFVALDTWDFAATKQPIMEPGAHRGMAPVNQKCPAPEKGPLQVTLRCGTPGAVIRYTFDGTTPGAAEGAVYDKPFTIDRTATIVAVAFKDGLAASPATTWTYFVEGSARPGLQSFSIGNSLTQTTVRMGLYTHTAGYLHEYTNFTKPGVPTYSLWEGFAAQPKPEWTQALGSMSRIDHFTVQCRDFDVDHEAKHDILFFNLIRAKSPDVQPWFYTEWTERARYQAPGARVDLSKGLPRYGLGKLAALPTDTAEFQSSETKLFPSRTWEESAGAFLLYVEEVQRKVLATYHEGKRPRILPTVLAVGWLKQWLAQGKLPGRDVTAFDDMMFHDCVHPGPDGAYLIDCVWFAAFYGQSPEGQVLPIGTSLTAPQAAALQRLAWDVVKNYPDCGYYEEGKEPCGKPQFASDGTTITLKSSTPGAWFRYTLDGSTPTRTRGCVYCGAISIQPGIHVQAIAYKSGMADSETALWHP
jgi:hypothetical protein